MRQLFPLLFFALFFALLAGANFYLAKRFSFYFDLRNPRFMLATFAGLTIFMLAGIIGFTNAQGTFANSVYIAASIIMGFLLYLLLAVAAVDLLNLLVKTNAKMQGLASIALAVAITGGGILNAQYKRISKEEIVIPGLHSSITIAHLSDIHIGHFWGPKTLQKIVDKTNAQQPDVVFITGDLFDGKIRLTSKSLEPLTHLNAPVYFVEGNHDGYSGANEIKQKLRHIGVEVLENEVTHFNQLQIIGLNHMRATNNDPGMHGTAAKPSMQSVLSQLNIFPDKPTVLLHHSPDGIELANKYGVNLYLAGHTHNGQLFPFNFVVRGVYQYNKGLKKFKNTSIYTSQGVGTFGPPIRVGTKSEIVILKLKPSAK
ncbi:metallophosphoesterase [uncultured Draconibacterium sp.]|uniref:metallophosphoesterase n=1 Tax=uncultured Draconibacterium sp. TaxID=1573823 RepID=UPI003260468C